ncbi:ribokinase family sugar kinase [Weissella kandleri]|uniref:Ribokinase n=1 Tax=Weissella kandleri TaxID=1616 RepID=A0A0R2JJS3_9LACO|nr:ribokinase [Weissella kandleri]KRN74519.1 ribokinase family sugar kinase [Weissella kandleri]
MQKVVVIGSLNIDVALMLDHLPAQGATIAVQDEAENFGGKGANQAVAASRQGAEVTFIGAVGADERGKAFKTLLADEGIDTQYIYTKEQQPTGSATILLEADGHNTIMVHGGANMALTVDDVQAAKLALMEADVVVAQLEVPSAVVTAGFEIAQAYGATTILNPAPVTATLDTALLAATDVIVPNETEAAALAGDNPTTDVVLLEATIVERLQSQGVKNLIITLGGDGVYYSVAGQHGTAPIFKVKAIDTTAAGDTFIGTLAANWKTKGDLQTMVRRSCKASSLAVSRSGAIASIPTKDEVDAGLATE